MRRNSRMDFKSGQTSHDEFKIRVESRRITPFQDEI